MSLSYINRGITRNVCSLVLVGSLVGNVLVNTPVNRADIDNDLVRGLYTSEDTKRIKREFEALLENNGEENFTDTNKTATKAFVKRVRRGRYL